MTLKPSINFYLAYLQWQTRSLQPEHFYLGKSLGTEPCHWNQQSGWPQAVQQLFLEESCWWQRARDCYQKILEAGIELVCYGEDFYPESFRQLHRPPLVVSYLGSSDWLKGNHLAVVGSRQLTHSSQQWIDCHLRSVVQQLPILVLSGGARGTDQAAHSLCLRLGHSTACFLPSGLLNPYPSVLANWFDPIISCGGAVISPYAPWEKMRRGHFHLRNHMMAALSQVVLAIDASRRSGTLITARAAMNYGKTVATVPTHPLQEQGLGGLDLLFDGAIPVRDDLDLLALLS